MESQTNNTSENKKSITRTANTVAQYLAAARRIELQARKDLMKTMPGSVDPAHPLTPMQLATWHVDRMRRGLISASTYRSYKASIICAFEELMGGDDETADAVEYLKDIEYSPNVRPTIKRASARKSKKITFDDMVKLCNWLYAHKGKFNVLSALWIFSNYHLGMRPCECESATLVEHEGVRAVRILNAKNTNGRSHGEFRHVPIGHLDEYTRESITAFLNLLAIEMEQLSFSDIKERCRFTIYRASRLCFSRRHNGISLYTMRHQFSANAKATLSLQETGALMGHKIADTSKINYAHARAGHKVEGLHAFQEEVDRVSKETPSPFERRQDVANEEQTS
ncbi:hypothetical protein ACKF11_13645 [Methylobacillus sp. Pita2]|uniref:hypothetical protein n=1 Tax=Methylobacillus sp. Pita2 TaxID=3383245 RepID=UPI0038B537E5